MTLVRKVGRPPALVTEEELRKALSEKARALLEEKERHNTELKAKLEAERSKPPEIVEVEKVVEKEVEKVVKVQDPILLQTVAELELENHAIQQSLQSLDAKTGLALKEAHLRILALETTLQQAIETSERRGRKLKTIKEAVSGRWPLTFKKTIRKLL